MMVPLLLLIVAMTTLPPSINGIVPPKTPVLSGFEPAAIGSSYRELVCDASQPDAGTITYKWYKFSTGVNGENWEPKGPIGTSQKYVFSPVTERKVFHTGNPEEPVSGKYLCRASNDAGTRDSEWGDLNVYTPCSLYTVSVSPPKPAIGSTFTLNCDIPNPSGLTVNLVKRADTSSEATDVAAANSKGCHAPSNPRYSWSSCSPPSISSPTFNLQVTNAQPEDFAYWICKDIGLSCDSNPVKPVVQAHPGTPQITGFPSGPVTVGTQLNLKCVASPPGDTYDWYKDGTKVTTSLSYDFQVTKESAGVYKCVARNDVGSASSTDKTLVVYYKPGSVVVSSGKTSSHVGEKDKFTCTVSGGNPTPTVKLYFKRSGGTPVEVTQGQDRVMAKEDNQAEYYCEAKITGYPAFDLTSSRKTYNVTFANTKVSFLNNPTAAVQAGQVKKFTCETDESNPVTYIKWYQYIGSSWRDITTGISSSERNGVSGGKIRKSEWSVTATKAMNGATVRCTSTYSLTGHDNTTKANTTLDVKYKPDSVVVSSGKTSSYVGEKDKFTCTVSGGNPTPTVKLYFKRSGGTPVEVTQDQDRVMAKEDNQAEYYCEAKVPGYPAFDMTSSRKTYNVTFSNTKVSFLNNPTSAVQVGQLKKFTCETDESNPVTYIKLYQLIAGSSWRVITTEISQSEENGVYGGKNRTTEWSVRATKVMNGVTVRCTSTYSLTGHEFTTYADTPMHVKFNPSKITMLQHPLKAVHEGKLITIVCETDSANPVANIQFHRKRTGGTWEQLTSGITSEVRAAEYNGKIRKSTLTVTANRSDNHAVFKCEVKVEGSFELKQNVTVDIYFPPNITISSDPKPVQEGDHLMLTCKASGGNPTSYTYKWFYKDNEIPNETSMDYKITNIQYNQSGKYRCRAINYSPDGQADGSLDVDVLYKAKWNPKLPEVFTVASKTNSSMEFILHVIANPSPSNVTWFFPNMTTIGGAFVAAKVNDTTYTLNKTSVAVKDYGNYIVNVTNAIGISTFTFELEKTAVPNVSLTVERKDNQVTVSWPKLSKEYTKIQIKFCPIEGGSCDYHNVSNTTSLKSSFTVNEGYTYTYSIIIFDGEDQVFVSLPVKVPTSLPIGAIAGGVGGFIFFLIIIAIVLAVVFILKKRRAKKETEVLTPSNNNGDVSVGQVNPGFSDLDARHNDVIDGFNPYEDSVEMIPPSSSVQIEATGRAEYAVVKKGGKKPTIGDAYTQVDFTKKKGGKKGSAQPPPGQAYAEVDFSKKAKGKGKGKAPVPTADPGDVDATVSKPKKPSKLPKAGKSGPDDAAVYANVPNGDDITEENLYEDIRKDEPKETGYRQPKEAYQVGVDGTVYSQVHISPPKNPDLIRGKETIEDPYASVDFTCQAPTLPEPEDPDDPNDPSFMMLL
ncbi:synaptogenesis protein syg-2-like isoform X2 [Lineus longissimus]|uniref:synaptogenesis protein syg-2-like isoform X2 n=1 Tax=Lineus longissimus TaxID=88925 RepID=UPI00315DDD66